jgi:hypothetical protein
MTRLIIATLVGLAVSASPLISNADPWKDERGKQYEKWRKAERKQWEHARKEAEKARERAEEYWEEQRERQEEYRERQREAAEDYWEDYEDALEDAREDNRPFVPPSPPQSYDRRFYYRPYSVPAPYPFDNRWYRNDYPFFVPR